MNLKPDMEIKRNKAAQNFFCDFSLPAFIVDKAEGLYMANKALAQVFEYDDLENLESRLAAGVFFSAHFSREVTEQFYEKLHESDGLIDGWLMTGRTLSGQEITLEIMAKSRFSPPKNPSDSLQGVFLNPGCIRDAQAFLQKAKLEAELAYRAKKEFLSNISHELRTPLNIILGMLSLAQEDSDMQPDTAENLSLAFNAADGLLVTLNDLIMLASLEAGALSGDMSQFTPGILLDFLAVQFNSKAKSRGLKIKRELGAGGEVLLNAGFNLMVLALEKLVDNAIKFSQENGEVILKASLSEMENNLWLHCSVLDDGPGLDESFIKAQDAFRQGDTSISRQHGGLGVGLRLASNLIHHLGGYLTLANRDCGGAELSISVPVKDQALTDYELEDYPQSDADLVENKSELSDGDN